MKYPVAFFLPAFMLVICLFSPQPLLAIWQSDGASESKDTSEAKPVEISFNRDIRPILSDKCFHCHGPDEESREAGLRFDLEADAFAVIEPGSPEDSELIFRINEEDPDSRMPPAEINKPLSAKEIKLLTAWVEQGANWSEFWAYTEPEQHPLPELKSQQPKLDNWIDQFVVARLEANQMSLSPPADRVTLIRRLYFDLVGLPPTPEAVEQFVNDESPEAVTHVVDQLLESKHFGERMAIYWLDLVRYADTVGYHGDQDHNISPYRDWVINAFNDNLPFDQFTRDQLAGDLVPDPTESQKIASGYNRLLQTTHEGGLQPKEYTAIYAADRVRNVSLVWMGATVGCAQCHDHKYDPYTAKDFYSLAAFFADVDDEKHFTSGTNALPTKRPPEMLVIGDAEQKKLDQLQEKIVEQTAAVAKLKKEIKQATKPEPSKQPTLDQSSSSANDAPAEGTPPKILSNTGGVDEANSVNVIVAEADSANRRTDSESKKATEELASLKSELADREKALKDLRGSYAQVESQGAWTMITQALKAPRTTWVLSRGDWMDESGQVVTPAIPEFLGTIETDAERATRLDLARWLTDKQGGGKLTARVFANRFWYLMMGVGISRSLDDFGGQGEPPAYPELLDNLALELIDSDWNVKQLIRQIATSQTYQQASFESTATRVRDPYNQFFSHQSRYRLPAEIIRDNALAISGLLRADKIGGKSVHPYQPAGYYKHLNFPPRKYVSDRDDQQWRRGVYVHWQRQFLHPSMKAFDAPTREECTAKRATSNTPAAALALLNDPIFVEAARNFAERMVRESKSDSFADRLESGFRLALNRQPEPREVEVLQRLYESSLTEFQKDETGAKGLLAVGQSSLESTLEPATLAAWTTIARAILNLNETITRN